MKKEIKKVVKYALSNGFERVKSHNGHIILTKGGQRISISSSPSIPEICAKHAMEDINNVINQCSS